MAIFGRRTTRRRIHGVARQSGLPPAPRFPADYTPWVLAGLWPVELSEITTETVRLAEYLDADLRRIADSANEQLKKLDRVDRTGPDGQAEQQRIIEYAREFAVRRVESTVRQIRDDTLDAVPDSPDGASTDAEPDFGHSRLQRLVAFVARQQPELRWAVGDDADGATVLVTDLAHGWIPPGIAVPAGVRLLQPRRRDDTLGELLGPTTLSATYTPGDRFGWPDGSARTEPSSQPRELPATEELQARLVDAVYRCDDLSPLVHLLAKAGADATAVIDAELDLLRVQLDTRRHELLVRYPGTDDALLLNCLLLAATEAVATGDPVSANYHFAWFQALAVSHAHR